MPPPLQPPFHCLPFEEGQLWAGSLGEGFQEDCGEPWELKGTQLGLPFLDVWISEDIAARSG